MKTIVIPQEIDVLIASSGGVGTTFLINHIKQWKSTNSPDNHDGLKHLPIPPLTQNKNVQAIYVFGDPVMATISLFRRQYHHTGSVAFQAFHPVDFIIPYEMTLAEYVAAQKEGLYLERHFKNWQEMATPYPVLFVRYEAIHDQLEAIRDYLGLSQAFIDTFPPRRSRKSNSNEVDPATLAALKSSISRFQRTIEDTKDARVKPATKTVLPPLSSPYRKAYLYHLSKKYPLFGRIIRRLKR